MLKKPIIAVLIPCYNEEKTIETVINDFKQHLPQADIYVYDNNSTDRTAELAEQAGAIVRLAPQQGKGFVIRKMFREINADCYLMIDGDNTYPADMAAQMVEPILAGRADMVIGDRLSSTYFEENKRPFHNTGNRMVRALINHIFKNNIRDIMTGYRAFSFEFVKTFPILSKGFEIETEMTIHALDKQLPLENVIIEYRDRPQGSESKLNTYSDGFKVIMTILRLFKNYQPFRFMSLISLILATISLCLFIPLFHNFLITGLVPRFPSLIMAGFIMMAALAFFLAGIILDVIVHQEKQNFELELIKAHNFKELLDHEQQA
ncbi:glycosyltransferase family 2 protein [Vaginisenegalia massiliensis]|uniref:glycosyltransferase family 2 protein n=1 Tax=Vaginisenegalia massiliensis TaxID=2058294 RepID=UPI000F53A3AA|nr:glycosyltransferase family 2 protein [Vaginisenegalia massiliensis]